MYVHGRPRFDQGRMIINMETVCSMLPFVVFWPVVAFLCLLLPTDFPSISVRSTCGTAGSRRGSSSFGGITRFRSKRTRARQAMVSASVPGHSNADAAKLHEPRLLRRTSSQRPFSLLGRCGKVAVCCFSISPLFFPFRLSWLLRSNTSILQVSYGFNPIRVHTEYGVRRRPSPRAVR